MKIKTKFYGEVEVREEDILYFRSGLPGFEKEDKFVYLHPERSVFGCLQSYHTPELAFVVISPYTVCPDYSFDLDDSMAEELGIEKPEEVLLLCIVTIPPGNVKEATVNLQAPVIVNTVNRRGCQVILDGLSYPIKCKIWRDGSAEAAAACE